MMIMIHPTLPPRTRSCQSCQIRYVRFEGASNQRGARQNCVYISADVVIELLGPKFFRSTSFFFFLVFFFLPCPPLYI